jgi:serine/threonine-protein kinase PknK
MGTPLSLSAAELAADFYPRLPLVGRSAQLAAAERALSSVFAGEVVTRLLLTGVGKSAFANEMGSRATAAGCLLIQPDSPVALLQQARVRDDGTPIWQLAASVLDRWVERGPVLINLDNVTLSDPLISALLQQLEADDVAAGVCVIVCADLPASCAPSRWQRIDLPRLDRAQTRKLVQRTFYHLRDIPFLEDIYPRTQGDPRAVGRLLRLQVSAGLPEQLVDDESESQQLDDLDARQRRLLALLALGDGFVPLPVLTHVADDVIDELARLLSRQLLAVDVRGVGLTDPKLGRQALEALDEAEQRAAHARYAAAYQASADSPVDSAVVAHHLVGSDQVDLAAPLLLSALAPHVADLQQAVAQLDQRCSQWRALVARLARIYRARGELDAALRLVEQLGDADAEYFGLLRAELFLDAGKPKPALAALEAISDRGAAPQLIFARAHVLAGEFELAAQHALSGLDQRHLSSRLETRLKNVLGLAWSYLGRLDDALLVLESAERVARDRDPDEGLARVLNSLGIVKQRLGQLEAAKRAFEQAGALFSRLGDLRLAATCALNHGTLAQRRVELLEALEAYEQAGSLSRRAELGTTWAWAAANQAGVLLTCGGLEQAERLVDEALAFARAEKSDSLLGHLLVLLSEIHRVGGQFERASSALDQAAPCFGEANQPGVLALSVARAELSLEQGQWQAARGSVEAILPQLSRGDPDHWRARLLAARVALAAEPPLYSEALTQLESALADEVVQAGCERGWELHALCARVQNQLGRKRQAQKHAERFADALEALREQVPPPLRPQFDQRKDIRAASDAIARIEDQRAPEHQALLGILSIYRDLNQGVDFNELKERTVEAMVSLTRAERGFLIAKRGNRLRVEASRNIDGDSIPLQRRSAGGERAPRYSRTIVERALRENRPLLIGDASQSELAATGRSVERMQLRSVLCVPVSVRGDVEGALYLDHRFSPDAFDESTVSLVQAFAELVGIATANTRLLSELTQRSEQLSVAKVELEQLNARLSARVSEGEYRLSEMTQRLRGHEAELERRFKSVKMVGRAKPMQALYQRIDRVAQADVPVFICGESGTGKELAARALHVSGPRSEHPFIAINCAAIPETLLESELFGYVKGAFTGADRDRPGVFELAGEGTLFLDEIGDMPKEMQVKLLRVLQEGRFRRLGDDVERQSHCRVVSASHRLLMELVSAGEFREDLYYRINVVQIDVPALRDRREDIPLLVRSLLEHEGLGDVEVTPAAMSALMGYQWPGNIRQLHNELQRAALVCEQKRIDLTDLTPAIALPSHGGKGGAADAATAQRGMTLKEALADHERRMIVAALDQHDFSVTKAAEALGLHRVALHRRMKALGIERR